MDSVLSYFVVGLVALGFGIFFARQTGNTVESQWRRAFTLAQEIVPALEQLYLTKKISKEQRLDMAMKELRIHFPDLQEKHLRWAIENAVKLMNSNQLISLEGVLDTVEDIASPFLKSVDGNPV